MPDPFNRPLPKRGRGRPRKQVLESALAVPNQALKVPDPETQDALVNQLKAQVAVLETQIKLKNDPNEELRELAEIIRIIQRAVKGMGADDDVFQGLINIKDIRERTRLDEAGLLSHSAMRVCAAKWPELKLFLDIADMEDPYFISENGEGRKEGILLRQAQTGVDRNNLVLNMPNTQGPIAQDPNNQAQPKKKGIVDRILKR